jgi:hypothetical protein
MPHGCWHLDYNLLGNPSFIFDIGCNVLKNCESCNLGPVQCYFRADGSSFQLNFVAALQNHAMPEAEECTLQGFIGINLGNLNFYF